MASCRQEHAEALRRIQGEHQEAMTSALSGARQEHEQALQQLQGEKEATARELRGARADGEESSRTAADNQKLRQRLVDMEAQLLAHQPLVERV